MMLPRLLRWVGYAAFTAGLVVTMMNPSFLAGAIFIGAGSLAAWLAHDFADQIEHREAVREHFARFLG